MKGLIYTYGATLLGAMLSIFYPLVGLMLFINFAIIQPPSMWYWIVPPQPYAKIIGGAMLVGWAVHGFGDWRFGRGTIFVLCLAGFLFWSVVATVFSDLPEAGWPYVDSVFKILLPFLLGMTLIGNAKQLRMLLWTLVLSQGYVAYELNSSYYAGYNRVCTDGFGGMDNNFVAVAMVAGTGLAFFLGLGERRIWAKGMAFLAATLMAHCVMFSFSRGGMLSLIITGVVAFWLVPKKPKYVVAFALAFVLALRLAGPEVRERFSSVFVEPEERDASASGRLKFWMACWDTMQKKPITGVGPNQWRIAAGAYGFEGIEAHSMWMQTGAEMGFPGLGLLLAFFGLAIWRLYPLTRETTPVPDPWFRDVARSVIASTIGFGVAAQFVSIYGLELAYYVVLAGALVLKFCSVPSVVPGRAAALTRFCGTPVVAQGCQ